MTSFSGPGADQIGLSAVKVKRNYILISVAEPVRFLPTPVRIKSRLSTIFNIPPCLQQKLHLFLSIFFFHLPLI